LNTAKQSYLEPKNTSPKLLTERALGQIDLPTKIDIINLAGDKPDFQVDTDRMERVFVSIIKNAFDAMPDGGKLTITCAATNDTVTFKFIDTGVGMTPEVINKLWLPLFTTKAKGMGFGLAICKRIIEAHGGKIAAKSIEGKGTTIIVQFPTQTMPVEVQETWV
jgi:signal transduction histidine kinase